ncbi:PREDICTED: 3-hydroxyisobutyryl-CoA hydrolase-like protein 1, mitochondrial isoform X1 [Populus euphratica]|uniref:3-hydroxyisobutyryl-CoA hydrolase n=1 Tax=Populus euphratica TaxID=75702 RepID=A0AAJ6XF95_POPEU|nr:PREDICTED: 3-hydroxyisobutyryl-CoA hydrolase-like protein 1, mitochondrial isoform X1 [Populus euphratica]
MQQGFKVLKSALNKTTPFSFLRRTLSSSLNSATNSCEDLENSVLVEKGTNSRVVILNRPHVLNALTTPMGHRLTKLYESWANDPLVDFIVLKVSICFSVLVIRTVYSASPQPLNHSVLSFL